MSVYARAHEHVSVFVLNTNYSSSVSENLAYRLRL